MDFSKIHPDQFRYTLPEEKIAKEPLKDRAKSKLLIFSEDKVSHHSFENIVDFLPQSSTLFFNDTKVIPARLIFHKATGAKIEIFLLEPVSPSRVVEKVMNSTKRCQWRCLIGNAKKWKIGDVLTRTLLDKTKVEINRLSSDVVEIKWENVTTFSELIPWLGQIPLPPYLNRAPNEDDEIRYQTVYSKNEGAVAAPTAGLHFTPELIAKLEKKLLIDHVTLHVSAGTFQPIKTSVKEHDMHREQIVISRENIRNLINASSLTCVGTTSLRTVESIYWYGVRLLDGFKDFKIEKLDPYQLTQGIDPKIALQAVIKFMDKNKQEVLVGETEIFIFPGYDFKLCKNLITNFHLPGTTLMMLIAAFIGNNWKEIYNAALTNNYRFLSYGDSSLLMR